MSPTKHLTVPQTLYPQDLSPFSCSGPKTRGQPQLLSQTPLLPPISHQEVLVGPSLNYIRNLTISHFLYWCHPRLVPLTGLPPSAPASQRPLSTTAARVTLFKHMPTTALPCPGRWWFPKHLAQIKSSPARSPGIPQPTPSATCSPDANVTFLTRCGLTTCSSGCILPVVLSSFS